MYILKKIAKNGLLDLIFLEKSKQKKKKKKKKECHLKN